MATGERLPATGTISEGREAAVVFGLYADTWSRLFMVAVMGGIFLWLNYSVMGFVEQVFEAESAAASPNRIVTAQVLMSLIGATAVQVGVAIIAIVSYLFPKGSKS